MTKRSWFAVVLTALFVTAIPVFAQDATVTGGDENSLRAFIARMFAPAPNVPVSTDVLIGALPADVSPFIPLPPGAQILGSVTTRSTNTIAQVYFDVPLPATLIAQFYHDTLTATGAWQESNGVGAVGFETGAAASSRLFCGVSPSTSTLNVDVRGSVVDANAARVSVTFQNGGSDPLCAGMSAPSGVVMPSEVIPALTAPAGSTVLGSVSGGGNLDQYYSLTTLQSTLPSSDIAAQYNAQLTASWDLTSSSGDASSAAATSTWTFTDPSGGQWTGILVVAANGADIRVASLQVIKAR